MVSERRSQIVNLYFLSGSVGFGEFPLSDPELPPSPYYLHFPKRVRDMSKLNKLFALIGEEFYELCESQDPAIRPKKIAGIPNGGNILARSLANQYMIPKSKLVVFRKIENGGQHQFEGPVKGTWEKGDDLLLVEDHTSGGHNKELFLPTAWDAGFVTPYMLDVVDREQGGVEAMAKHRITKLSIFTITQFMREALNQGHITGIQLEAVQEYKAQFA